MKKILLLASLLILAPVTPLCAEEAADDDKVFPKKVEADRNKDGKVDHVEYYENGSIARVEDDANGDGIFEQKTSYDKGVPVKSEKDTDGDGKPDTWITY